MHNPSVLQLPLLTLAYADPRRRQDKHWSYRQALSNSYLKMFLRIYTTLHLKWPLSLKPHGERGRFALIEPADPVFYSGVAEDVGIKPETIGATWYPNAYSSEVAFAEGQYILLHLHGGAYILGDGRTASSKHLAETLLECTPSSYLLCPQYRLAFNPNGRFPAQLQDAISSYSYLIHTLNIPAARIVLSGDSSGGHLALALLRYIVDYNKQDLPAPKCSLLWSPWCDVPAATDPNVWNQNSNYRTEYIPGSFPEWGAKQFLKGLKITETIEPYVAPIRHPFTVPSPVLLVTGNREVLFQEHERLARDFQGLVLNNKSPVELYTSHSVPHDVLMIGWIMGYKKEARDCARQAGEFIARM